MSAQGASRSKSTSRAALHKPRGASRLEALIVVLLIGIVVALLLERLTRYQEYAEKAVMEATIANMRSGLRIRVAELMINGEMAQMPNLLQENPITWLAAPPANYAGVLQPATAKVPAPGHWYFDAPAGQLVYLPQHHRFFRAGADGKREVRWQVMPLPIPPLPYTAAPPRPSSAKVEGIALRAITFYQWDETI
jgi:competence protein ComGC